MSNIKKVEAKRSCINCAWFGLSLGYTNGSYDPNTIEVECENGNFTWDPHLNPDPKSDAIASPDKMKCSQWRSVV